MKISAAILPLWLILVWTHPCLSKEPRATTDEPSTTPAGAVPSDVPIQNGAPSTDATKPAGNPSSTPTPAVLPNPTALPNPNALPNPTALPNNDAPETQRKIKQVLQKLDREPSLEKIIESALCYGDADTRAGATWAKRVRRAPLLPTIKVSAGYDIERDESLDRTQDAPDRWGADTDNDLGFQVTAQWDLGDLVFNGDELKVDDALAERAERRESLIAQIIGSYFERRRLQLIQALTPPQRLEEQIQQTIRIQELTALIDALTGGILTRNL